MFTISWGRWLVVLEYFINNFHKYIERVGHGKIRRKLRSYSNMETWMSAEKIFPLIFCPRSIGDRVKRYVRKDIK